MRHRVTVCLALLTAAVLPRARAQEEGIVQRSDLLRYVPVSGMVRTAGVIQVLSPAEGRVDRVQAEAYLWAHPDSPLGFLVDKEFAALLDSDHTTPEDVLRERWKTVFQPIPFRCPADCYVLSVEAKPKAWVPAGEPMLTAATELRLDGTFRAKLSRGERARAMLEVWSKTDPGSRWKAPIKRLSDGSVAARLPFGADLRPGTAWEGVIEIPVKRNVLKVPAAALIRRDGAAYLPLRVATGASTEHETEILSIAREGDRFLILQPDRWSPFPAARPRPQAAPRPERRSAQPSPAKLAQPEGAEPELFEVPSAPGGRSDE